MFDALTKCPTPRYPDHVAKVRLSAKAKAKRLVQPVTAAADRKKVAKKATSRVAVKASSAR